MIHRIGLRKYKVYALDIETHNDLESLVKMETSMWLGCLIDENSKVDDPESYFYTMDELIDRLDIMSSPKRKSSKEKKPCKNICIYIYNLSFEWSFLLPVLLQHGFKAVSKVSDDSVKEFSSVTTKSVSSVWDIELKFSKKHGKIIFKDLAKIYGGGLGKVAKSFNLETQKGEIDYRLNRLHNYQITKEEKEYCFKDTKIIIEILQKLDEDKDFWNISSIASYSMKHLLKAGFPKTFKPYKEFRKMYPELDQEETDFLRRGVEGGITYATPKYQFKDIKGKVYHIDIHQAHPFSAWKHLYPYGKGEYFKGEAPKGKISACRIRIGYDGVYLHSIIKLIGMDYIEDFELVVWNFEIPTMMKCYKNLRIKYIDGYAYKMSFLPWRHYYMNNYNKRLIAKKNHDDFNTLRYKLLNNSSYGKLLEKPHNDIMLNTVNKLGIIDSVVEMKAEKDCKVNAKYTYLPVGSSIPARTRVYLVETALKFGWEKILYFDTDSIFILWDEEVEKVWNTQINQKDELGGWALEETIGRCMFTAPKRYKTQLLGKDSINVSNVKAGGINFDDYLNSHFGDTIKAMMEDDPSITQKEAISRLEIPFEEINITNDKFQVQRALRCKGGTIIVFQEKEMSIQKKYRQIYEKNVK